MVINLINDDHFDFNEWFVVVMIIGGFVLFYLLPKIFSVLTVLYSMLIGLFFGLVFDHTFGIPPLDFYDVGDSPSFSLFDILSYAMYAPFGYHFIYFYEKLHIKGQINVFYIVIWTAMAILLEWGCVKVGVFHYKNGYKLYYSILVYLLVESQLLFSYLHFFRKKVF